MTCLLVSVPAIHKSKSHHIIHYKLHQNFTARFQRILIQHEIVVMRQGRATLFRIPGTQS